MNSENFDNPDNNFVTLAELLQKVYQGKLILLSCIGLSLIIVSIYNYMATPLYKASSVVAFEIASQNEMLNIEEGIISHRYVLNRVKEIQTQLFAERVYQELSSDIRNKFTFPDPQPENFDKDRYIVGKIRAGVSAFNSDKLPNVITITFQSEVPEITHVIANIAAKVLLKSNLQARNKEYSNLRAFIDEQLNSLQGKLTEAEDAFQDFKVNTNVSSMEDESREILNRITSVENLLNTVQVDIEANEKRLREIRRHLGKFQSDSTGTLTQATSLTINNLRTKLSEQNVQLMDLKAQGYKDDHPKVATLIAEVESMKRDIINTTKKLFTSDSLSGVIDPLVQAQTLLTESIRLDTELKALKTQNEYLQKILASYNQRLSTLIRREADHFRLLRERDINNKLFVQLLEEREQVRLREAAEIGNIRILDFAIETRSPVSPRKGFNTILAIFLGSALGFIILFLRENLKTPLYAGRNRSPYDTTNGGRSTSIKNIELILHGLPETYAENDNNQRNGSGHTKKVYDDKGNQESSPEEKSD